MSTSTRKYSVRARKDLLRVYDAMASHYGPTHWWPGDTAFEVAVGAILTQNTAWVNVEKALANLKRERLLTARRIAAAPTPVLEAVLRPSGYYRQKTARVQRFCNHLLAHYDGSMKRMARRPLDKLREELLSLNGVGPETADDILLYACGKTVFVIDAYTRRIFGRHGLVDAVAGYEELRAFFETNVEKDLHRYQEYHGLIVWTGKDFCRKKPRCEDCPLGVLLRGRAPAEQSPPGDS